MVGARLAENGLGHLFPVFGLSYVINTLHMRAGGGIRLATGLDEHRGLGNTSADINTKPK